MKRTTCLLLGCGLLAAGALFTAPASAAGAPAQIRFLDADSASFGSYVGIYGQGFGTTQGSVSIGSTAVTDFTLWSDNLIIVRIPAGASSGAVQVTPQGSPSPLQTLTPLNIHVGTLYYVSANTGNDANSGDEQNPFQSIRKALSVVVPGDTILLGEGVYDEKDPSEIPSPALFLKASFSGSASKPLTIRGLGAEIPTIRGSTEPSRENPVAYLGSDYLRLARVKIDGTGNLSSGVSVQGSDIWMTAVEVTAFTAQGILGGESTSLVLRGSHIHDGGTTVGESHAVVLTGTTGTIRDNLVENIANGFGLLLRYQTQGSTLVAGNRIHDVAGPAIALHRVKGGNRIFNNAIWNAGTSLGCLCSVEVGYGSQSGEGATIADRVYYNTFAGPGSVAVSLVERSGNLELHGNIFADFQGGLAVEDTASANALRSSHNLWFNSAGTPQFRLGADWIDFDAFKAGAGQENFSLVADPKLVDPATANLHLAAGSPAIDVGGGPDVPTDDFDGFGRPMGSAADWGAFETEGPDGGAPDGGPDAPAPDGAAGASGDSGAAGAAGGTTDAAAGDTGVAGDASTDDGGAGAPPAGGDGDDGGCGCSVPGSSRSLPALLIAAISAAVAIRRRRH